MLALSQNDMLFIKANFPKVEADDMLVSDDVRFVLRKIYDLIEYKGFDENNDYNGFGRSTQAVYDSIYLNN